MERFGKDARSVLAFSDLNKGEREGSGANGRLYGMRGRTTGPVLSEATDGVCDMRGVIARILCASLMELLNGYKKGATHWLAVPTASEGELDADVGVAILRRPARAVSIVALAAETRGEPMLPLFAARIACDTSTVISRMGTARTAAHLKAVVPFISGILGDSEWIPLSSVSASSPRRNARERTKIIWKSSGQIVLCSRAQRRRSKAKSPWHIGTGMTVDGRICDITRERGALVESRSGDERQRFEGPVSILKDHVAARRSQRPI